MVQEMITAEVIASKMKEVSVAEFFEKNRHLLGYENPTKALITVIKELVDNSLDAAEDSRILPNIKVTIKEVAPERFRIIVEDNGPGIVREKLPLAFGKLLYGSKFHRLIQGRGTQGLGASLTYDSLIALKDGRFLEIGRIVENGLNVYILSLDDKKNKIIKEKVVNLIKNPPTTNFIEIVTYGNFKLRLTPEHLMLAKRTEKSKIEHITAKNLKEGMYLPLGLTENDVTNPHETPIPITSLVDKEKYHVYNRLTSNINMFLRLAGYDTKKLLPKAVEIENFHRIKLPSILNTDLCWFIGFLASHGHVGKRKNGCGTSIPITNNILLEKSENMLKSFGLDFQKYEHTDIHFASIVLAAIARKFGIKFSKKSNEIELSDFVLQLPNRLLSAYLRGLYDGNGSIIIKKDGSVAISFDTKSRKLAKKLQLVLLTRFGIFSSFERKRHLKSGYVYTVRIYSKHFIKQFFSKIGFTAHPNLSIVQNFLQKSNREKTCYYIYSDKLYWTKIKEIKKIKSKLTPTYDLTINNYPYFCANGLIVHNSGAILYSQLTTGKPVKITSSTGNEICVLELLIDVLKNEPKILSEKIEKNPTGWHGIKIEMEVEGRYVEKGQSVLEYLKQTAISNPYAHIVFDGPNGKYEFKRTVNELPKQPREIKPHPYGVEVGLLRRMALSTKARNILGFLTSDFSRVGKTVAEQICRLAKVEKDKKPQQLTHEEIERLHKAMQMVKLMSPPTDCLSPLGEKLITEGLKKELGAEYLVTITRSPSVYRGNPFLVEVGLAYGGNLPQDKQALLLRFSNKVPLLYHQSDCAITEAVTDVDWKRYGFSQPQGQLPVGPLAILVHFASVWVPYTSEGKQAIANYPEIIKEIKLALQEAGRKLAAYIRHKARLRERQLRRELFERYIPEVANALSKLTKKDSKLILNKLENMIKRKDDKHESSREKT